MITHSSWLRFVDYICDRITSGSSLSLSDDFLIENFHFVRPFWNELEKLAREERLPFVFNGHHFVSILEQRRLGYREPTQIVFERRVDSVHQAAS